MNSTKIKVALVDDHPLMRAGLIKQLATDEAIEVIMEASNGQEFLDLVQAASILPDVAIMDLRMPVMDGFALADELKDRFPSIKILVLSAYTSEYNIGNMVQKGVRGYLLKDCPPSEFRAAVHAIHDNGYYYSEIADEKVFKIFEMARKVSIPEREMEFLKLCCSEHTYNKIAEEMGITMKTLEGMKERLFNRLGVSSRTALVVFAMQSGFGAHEDYNITKLRTRY